MIFLSKWVICRFHVNLPGCSFLGGAGSMVEALVVIWWRFFFDFSMILMADITEFFLSSGKPKLEFCRSNKTVAAVLTYGSRFGDR